MTQSKWLICTNIGIHSFQGGPSVFIDGYISAYICPNCDHTHLAISVGESIVSIAMAPKYAERLADLLMNPPAGLPEGIE